MSFQGEKEISVAHNLIRPIDEVSSSASTRFASFREGDKVEALYKGKGSKWFSGKISRANSDGTYDIRYDDGDSESAALSSNIRIK